MKHVRVAALLLALLMLLPLALSGCSRKSGTKSAEEYYGLKKDDSSKKDNEKETEVKETEPQTLPQTGAEPAETKPAETEPEIPEDTTSPFTAERHDFGGHDFYFLVRELGKYPHLSVNEVYAEELTGDKVNDAVFQRNSAIQSEYNCSIYEDRVENPATAIKEQLLAGEYQYDFIYTGVASLRPLSASGLLVDFRELAEVDLSKAWWDQNAIEGFSIAGKTFCVTGSASTMDERSSWVVFFNKDIIENAHLQSPYELVTKGKWTVDKMTEYVYATWSDLDGNGIMEIGKDRFGYISDSSANWMHVAACNCRLSRYNADTGDIEIPATINKNVLEAWAALKPLLTTEYRVIKDTGFSKGDATFYACYSATLFNIAKNDINWGILPMPKLNEEQEEYYTSVSSAWCYAYAIPVTVELATDAQRNGFDNGLEQAGYFLELFSYKSMDTLEDAYYDQIVKHQIIKDEKSAEMMKIALKNKVYDPAAIFDFGKIGTSLFKEAGSNVTSSTDEGGIGTDVNYDTLVALYESRVTSARKALKNYINYISE